MADLPDRVKKLLPNELLYELLAGAQVEEEIVGPDGLLTQLTKRLAERDGGRAHRPPPPYAASGATGGVGNARNGSTPRTLITEHWAGGDRHTAGIATGHSSRRSSASARDGSRSSTAIWRRSMASTGRTVGGARCFRPRDDGRLRAYAIGEHSSRAIERRCWERRLAVALARRWESQSTSQQMTALIL